MKLGSKFWSFEVLIIVLGWEIYVRSVSVCTVTLSFFFFTKKCEHHRIFVIENFY